MAEENLTTNEGNKDNPRKGIRTLEDDIAEYTKEKNFSILDIAAEEAKVRGLSFENSEEGKGVNFKKISIILLVALFFVAGGYFGIAKPLFKKNNIANNLPQITEGPILTDQKIEIIANEDKKEVFARDLKSALEAEGNGGNLTEISIVKITGEQKTNLNKDEFFSMLRVQAPQGLKDYLEKDFMLLNFGRNGNYPVLVFKAKSYAYVFSEMLKWEKSMINDLKPLFPNGDLLGNDSFADKYVQNHDARVAEKNGKIDLIYSFADRKYLLVSNSAEALTETFRRFSSIQYANPRAGW